LIGINSVVLDGAVLGAECLVGALSLILHGMKVPERRLLIGSPARIVRTMSANEVTWRNDGDGAYQLLTREALASFREVEPMRQRQPKRESLRAPARPVRPNQS
jgi:phenylacetic acid degradation protein